MVHDGGSVVFVNGYSHPRPFAGGVQGAHGFAQGVEGSSGPSRAAWFLAGFAFAYVAPFALRLIGVGVGAVEKRGR